jgi:hypothetical protein
MTAVLPIAPAAPAPVAPAAPAPLLGVYKRAPMTLTHGAGVELFDADGRAYLDFVSGIAVNALGYGDPGLTAALHAAAAGLVHTSNLYRTEPGEELARFLVEHSFADAVFFCNSGAEANEGAFKMARKWARSVGGAEARHEVLSLRGAFHGRLFGTLAATDRPAYRLPLPPPRGRGERGGARPRRPRHGDGGRHRRGGDRRAGAGRGRRARARRGLPARAAGAHPRARRAAHPRRDPVRDGAHRDLLRLRAGGDRARHRHPRQAARGRAADGRGADDGRGGGGDEPRATTAPPSAAARSSRAWRCTWRSGSPTRRCLAHVRENGAWLGEALAGVARRTGRVRAIRGVGYMWGLDTMEKAGDVWRARSTRGCSS